MPGDDIRNMPFGGPPPGGMPFGAMPFGGPIPGPEQGAIPFTQVVEMEIPLADGTEPGIGEPDYGAWQQDFHGLLKLGYLTSTFDWCGHRFVIKTLRTSDILVSAMLIKEWQDTIGGSKAYATSMVALCTELVDGRPLPIPLGEDPANPMAWAHQRFNYVQQWFPWTIDAVLNEYNTLERRVIEVIRQMGKGSAPTAGSSERSDSPTDGGSSPAPASRSSRKKPSASSSS